jgi:hypothetical protein
MSNKSVGVDIETAIWLSLLEDPLDDDDFS